MSKPAQRIRARVQRARAMLPAGVVAGAPRREVAQEFYTNVLELGKYAKQRYMDECKRDVRKFNMREAEELDRHIETLEKVLQQLK